MSVERRPLAQQDGVPLLSDGGLETTLVFHHGIDLPAFSAFDLLRQNRGRQVRADYFRSSLSLAREAGLGYPARLRRRRAGGGVPPLVAGGSGCSPGRGSIW